ncbi:MAG: hypothetical protein ABWY06_21995 [Pseudomonas sp.]|uniref:hypothetical protein n=1 Tax=Pseudomonas sp. TaxID=306 RepID=UPI003392BE25
MKFISAAAATLLFVSVLVIVYCVHISYFRVGVVFYAAIADGVISAALTGIVLCAAKVFRSLGSFEKVQLIVIWLLLGYALAISVPTVIDRSLSFYLLEKLQQRGGGIAQASFEQLFAQEYMREHHLVEVRLTEQLESGTIEIVNGCVKLTKKGARLASFARYFRQHWLPKQRLLMGDYSDKLTDPFRNSQIAFNYLCD